ncbi:MAG TPA: DUF6600 domain-containing protein [Vicinamibacterales bacterium]|jgi:hypothetical protein
MTCQLRRWSVALLALVPVIAAAQPVLADPPTRVARLNYVKGSVSFRPASLDDWGPATLNYPITTGDHLWTDTESWAEMHVGSTAIRLAPNTAFAVFDLDDEMTQVSLSEGSMDVRVRDVAGSAFEIDTPSAAISLVRPGVYRVDVVGDGGTVRVTVRRGIAQITPDGPGFSVSEGQEAAIFAAGEHDISRATAPDSWERWCRGRDDREDRAASLRYVSYEMTGYEDLDDYGSWHSEPDYGWVWQPSVVNTGWAPYRTGQWRWVEPWGWSWVDEAPWGFAPFHYGRWACLRGSWMWVPGGYVVRPVYAPALVAFVGGDHWALSFGLGREGPIGWFPLAPGEVWMPHYRASRGYIRDLNVTNVNITNIDISNYGVSRGTYVNRAIDGAVTAVPREAFGSGVAVARHAVAVAPRMAMTSDVIGTSALVVPRAESLVGRHGSTVPRPGRAVFDRAVVARTAPPPAPVPFRERERSLQANGGRPLDEGTLGRLRDSRPGSASDWSPVRLAGRGGRRPGESTGGESPASSRVDTPPAASAPAPSGGGLAMPRYGQRRPVDEDRGQRTQPGSGVTVAPRSEVNDRPDWGRRRASEPAPAATRPTADAGAGIALPRYGRRSDDRPSGEVTPRPNADGWRSVPEPARPRVSERPSGGETTQPNASTPRATPDFARPRFGDRPSPQPENRPSGGIAERPRGADRQAAPPSSQQRGAQAPTTGGPKGGVSPKDGSNPKGGGRERPKGGD